MRYILKPHAKERMKERKIPEHIVKTALDNPDKIGYDARGRLLIKKVYRKNGKERLLLAVGEFAENVLEIITVIDTSKIKKYL